MIIVTDCAADMPEVERLQHGIIEAPLYIQFPDGEVNSAELTPDEFYQRLEDMHPQVPSTAQPSSGIFSEMYQKLSQEGKEIVSIHVSSGLSGTINSARMGASSLVGKAIHVVDSLTLSGGQRFQVWAAAKASSAGWDIDRILERLQTIRDNTEVVFTLDTLEYLSRGGRIGRVQALMGSVLKIKPIIHVDHKDGKYSTLGKTRTIPSAITLISEHIHQLYDNRPLWVSIMHGKFLEGANELKSSIENRLNIAKLEILRISPVLGVHTGPGIVGAAVVPMELMDNLL